MAQPTDDFYDTEFKPADLKPPPINDPVIVRMRAQCWYCMPQLVNDAIVIVGIWFYIQNGAWVRSPLSLLGLAFGVGFVLRLLQLVTYSEVLNQVVFNTLGHNIVLWLIVMAQAVYFVDKYQFFSGALFLLVYHLLGCHLLDLPGRLLVERANGYDAETAFEERLRARAGLPPLNEA